MTEENQKIQKRENLKVFLHQVNDRVDAPENWN